MGGLWVDYDQMTEIPGLFAAGECDYSQHGANRLRCELITYLRFTVVWLQVQMLLSTSKDLKTCGRFTENLTIRSA